MQKKIKLNCPFSMLAVKVVETKDHLKSAINLVNQKVRMQHLVEFQLLEFAILYKARAFSVCFVRTSSNCPSSVPSLSAAL